MQQVLRSLFLRLWFCTIADRSWNKIAFKSNLLFFSLYYAEACDECADPHPRHCDRTHHSSIQRNAAAVASRWQHYVRFDRPEIWTSDCSRQRWTRYRSTNRPIMFYKFISTISLFNVKLINRINTPSIFYCADFACGKIERQIIQQIQLVFKHLLCQSNPNLQSQYSKEMSLKKPPFLWWIFDFTRKEQISSCWKCNTKKLADGCY